MPLIIAIILHHLRFDDRFARRSHFHSNLKSVEVGLGRPKSGPTFVPVGAWFAPGSIAFCLKAIASRIPLIFSKFSSLIPQLDLRAPLFTLFQHLALLPAMAILPDSLLPQQYLADSGTDM